VCANDARVHFEDFAVNEGLNVKRDSSGGYTTKITYMAWLSWLSWLSSKRMYESLPVTSSTTE
jgi:hypothetical protein